MTRFIFLILFALASTVSYAQFTDDFSDGDFSANPTWSGDTNNFDVNGAFQFQLNAPAVNDVMYASTPSSSINNAVWEFYV
ncbi:MAG TPA: hypothetical protein VKZ45_09050, partial [Vicingaceae bacterium]|nr:hypothetical protein [Vicingaceae bacterium]